MLTLLPSAPEWKPWEQEPNELFGERAGYPTQIRRITNMGHLCGYVGVPSFHPASHGKEYDLQLSVHGGITYRHEHDDGLLWIGFDCAHLDDLVPAQRHNEWRQGTYRDIEYVKAEVESLADQLVLMAAIDRALSGV